MKTEALLIGAGVLLVLATKGKVGSYVGDSLGQAVAGVPTGIIKGTYKATKNYVDYFNEEGKSNPLHLSNLSWTVWSAGQKIKNIGSDKYWFK